MIVRIDLAGDETRGSAEQVTFSLEDVIVRERDHGITITAKSRESLGFHSRFFPWSQVRRVEYANEK